MPRTSRFRTPRKPVVVQAIPYGRRVTRAIPIQRGVVVSGRSVRRYTGRRRGRATGSFWKISAAPFMKQTIFRRLKYAQSFQRTTGTAGVFGTEQVFNLNSLFDPDSTGAGHQPYGFDALALQYRRYMVYGCLIDIKWHNPSADSVVTGAMIVPTTAALALVGLDANDARERDNIATSVLADSGSQTSHVRKYVSIPKIDGIGKAAFKAQYFHYGMTVGANPPLMPLLKLGIASDSHTSGVTCECSVVLTYYAKFWEVIAQASS